MGGYCDIRRKHVLGVAFMGVPSILYPIAENQKLIASGLANIHAALELPGRTVFREEAAGFISMLLKKEKNTIRSLKYPKKTCRWQWCKEYRFVTNGRHIV